MLLAPLLSLVTTFVIRKFGTGLIDLHVITSSDAMGAVFAVLLSTLVADFFLYWYHRLRHANRILWETHLVHHSDKHMNVTTYARGHFTELVLLPVVVTAPISFLFQLPPVSIAILSLIPRVWEYFTHANLKIGFGRLWWLAVSPDYHRIHHSIEKKHFDKNFATWFPLWDILFSTAWRPQSGERPATGVEGINANSVFELFTLPFVRWSKLSRKN